MRNVLIVFSGKAGSGKSTSAKLLKQIIDEKDGFIPNHGKALNILINGNFHQGTRAEIHSFAAALKIIATEYFNWDGNKDFHYDKDGLEPLPDKGRQLLINIGQTFRKIRPTVWVDYVINNIKKADENTSDKFFIIDDLRFQNELALAKTFHTCISIRLARPEQLDIKDISEVDLDGAEFDYKITNDGDMEKLKIQLTETLNSIVEKYK